MNFIESGKYIKQGFEYRLVVKNLYEKVRKLWEKQQKIMYENYRYDFHFLKNDWTLLT